MYETHQTFNSCLSAWVLHPVATGVESQCTAVKNSTIPHFIEFFIWVNKSCVMNWVDMRQRGSVQSLQADGHAGSFLSCGFHVDKNRSTSASSRGLTNIHGSLSKQTHQWNMAFLGESQGRFLDTTRPVCKTHADQENQHVQLQAWRQRATGQRMW